MAHSRPRVGPGPRLWKRLCLALLIGSVPAAAVHGGDDDALLAELQQLAEEAGIDLDLPSWDVSGGVSVGAGYRTNVTLSALAPDESAFLRAAADVLAWRLPDNGVEWVAFFDGSYDHFFSAESERGVLTISRGEWRWKATDGLRLAAALQHVYQDEVVDTTTMESSALVPTQTRLHQLDAQIKAAWDFAGRWTLRGQVGVQQAYYHAPLDDYVVASAELRLERGLGRAGRVQLVGGWAHRAYENLEQTTGSGRPLLGTLLRVQQPRVGLRHFIKGGKKAKWSLQTDAAWLGNRDNNEGWYDYDRGSVDLAFGLEKKRWNWTVDAGWMRYLYKHQRSGVGTPPLRERETWSLATRIEWTLKGPWKLFSEVSIENNPSNDPFMDYNDRLVLAGVRWER